MSIPRSAAVTLTGVLGLLACAREPARGVTNTQGPGMDTTIAQMAAARCDRERRCERIGAGRAYDSIETCETKMRARIAPELSDPCPGGPSPRSVADCLDAIRTEVCSGPMHTLERYEKCRSASLCTQQDYR